MKFAIVSGSGSTTGPFCPCPTYPIARSLAANGHEVTLIRKPTPENGTLPGVCSIDLSSNRSWPGGTMLRCWKVARKLQEFAPDVLHFHAPGSLLGEHWRRMRLRIPGALKLLSCGEAEPMPKARRNAGLWIPVPNRVFETNFEQEGPGLETYLALIDHHRRGLRIRFDRAQSQPAPPPAHRRAQVHPSRVLDSQANPIGQAPLPISH